MQKQTNEQRINEIRARLHAIAGNSAYLVERHNLREELKRRIERFKKEKDE